MAAFESLLNRDSDTSEIWEEEINERVWVLNYVEYPLYVLSFSLLLLVSNNKKSLKQYQDLNIILALESPYVMGNSTRKILF